MEEIPAELIYKKAKHLGIKFNGENKQSFNLYFEPKQSEQLGTCSRDYIVGEWIVVFSGTQYKEIYFTIINQTMPGDTRTFESLEGKGTS